MATKKQTKRAKPAPAAALIRDRITDFRRVPASQIEGAPWNWRNHGTEQTASVKASLEELGIIDVLRVRELGPDRYQLWDGHLREELYRGIGPDTMVPIIVTDLDEAEAKKANLVFDPLAAMADSDKGKLDELLRQVETGSEDLAKMLDELARDAGCEWAKERGEIVEDEVPDPPANPVTQPGDLWLLGEHRLLCGNSSDPRDVQSLCPASQWDVAVIDPPYEASVTAWLRWIMDPCIVFGQVKHLRLIPDHLWRFERVIVKRYRHRSATTQVAHGHALVAQCGTAKVLPSDKKATMQSVVEQELKTDHDHQKPVALLVEHLTHWTPLWKCVVDPYAGSGATILAAERMGRKCLAMEIDAGWCDVIVQRWEAATGRKAQRIANKEVEAYNAGRAGAVTPATPKHAKAAKEPSHV